MSTAIWKYRFKADSGEQTQDIPAGKLLRVGPQHGELVAWFEVEPGSSRTTRTFEIIRTGQPIPPGATYCGSADFPPFVWHLLEYGVAK